MSYTELRALEIKEFLLLLQTYEEDLDAKNRTTTDRRRKEAEEGS